MAVEVLIPNLNPIRFVQVETVDYDDIFPNIDNRLFVDEEWIDTDQMRYRDKYLKEKYRIQFFANFGAAGAYAIADYFSGKIYDMDGVEVLDFTSSHQPFDISGLPAQLFHYFEVDFSGFSEGCYYGKITIYDGDGITVESEFYSGTFEVKSLLKDYLKFEIKNSENDFGWIFTDVSETPIESTSLFYLPGSMMELIPGQVKSTYKDDLAEVFNLDTRPERNFKCDVFAVPSYIVDRLNLAFSCNQIFINDFQYQNEEGLSSERLGSGNLFDIGVNVSQKNWNYYQNVPDSDTFTSLTADLEDGGLDDVLENHVLLKDGGENDDLDGFEMINDGD